LGAPPASRTCAPGIKKRDRFRLTARNNRGYNSVTLAHFKCTSSCVGRRAQ
jgi:predicted secreted protein